MSASFERARFDGQYGTSLQSLRWGLGLKGKEIMLDMPDHLSSRFSFSASKTACILSNP